MGWKILEDVIALCCLCVMIYCALVLGLAWDIQELTAPMPDLGNYEKEG